MTHVRCELIGKFTNKEVDRVGGLSINIRKLPVNIQLGEIHWNTWSNNATSFPDLVCHRPWLMSR